MPLTRRVILDSRCHLCGLEGEFINHVLFRCTAARQIWALSNFPSPENGFAQSSVYSNFHHLLSLGKKSHGSYRDKKSCSLDALDYLEKQKPFVL